MFDSLARVALRPRMVLVIAFLMLLGLAVLGHGASARLLSGGSEDPSAQSSRAVTTLNERFPASIANLVLLVRPGQAGQTVDAPAVSQQGQQLAQQLAGESGVVGVQSYWQARVPSLRSTNGGYALILAHITGDDTQVDKTYKSLATKYDGAHGDAVVQLGGQAAVSHDVRSTISSDLKRAEVVVFPVTLIILILVFGSVVAALLPLAVGIISILGTEAVLKLITQFTSVSIFSQNLTTALGLGLAIDYALFIVRRFREEQRQGLEPREAIAVTLRTAGRTVVFSACTVAVSLSAMLVFPQFFLRSFAYAGISVVIFAAVAALTVLPALLVLLGGRIEAWNLRRLFVRGRRGARGASPVSSAGAQPSGGSGWRRLTGSVMRRAPIVAVATVALLAVLGLPFFGVKFGTADYRQLSASAESRTVQQLILDDFTSNPSAVIEVLAGQASGTIDPGSLTRYAAQVSSLAGVTAVSSPVGTFRGGQQVAPASAADAARVSGGYGYLSAALNVPDISTQSENLVRDIRALSTPFPTLVAGNAATVVDSEHAIGTRLAYALGIIAAATLILIFLLTGSLLIPLLAVVLSGLSLTAMFGAVVWVFQDGHGSGLLGFTATGFIDITLPVLMFCVAFGLSMDYTVFLLSRIKEEYDRRGENRSAIMFGVERTGGIITAAAVILAIVLVAVGSSRITNIKMLGLGTALAVLVDALIVRCLLVPSVMTLTGRATWWAPGPLARFQRRFGLREEPAERAAEPADRVHVTPGATAGGLGGSSPQASSAENGARSASGQPVGGIEL